VVVLDQVAGWLGRILPPSSPARRLAFSFATLSLVFVMSGLGMSRVAAFSLPDSPLYPIKLATEHVQLVLAPSPGERARLHIAFAERRVAETRAQAENGGDVDRLVVAMIRQNKQAFGAIAEMPAQDRAPLLADLAAVTRIERRALTELKYRLSPEGQRLVSDAIAYSAEDQARAEEARANPGLVRLIPTSLPPIMTGPAQPTPVPPTPTAVKVIVPARSDTDKPDRLPTEVPTQAPKPTRPAPPPPTSPPPPPPPAPTEVVVSQPDVSEPDRDQDDEDSKPAATPVAPQPTGVVTDEPTAEPTVPPDFAEPTGTPEPLP